MALLVFGFDCFAHESAQQFFLALSPFPGARCSVQGRLRRKWKEFFCVESIVVRWSAVVKKV